MKIKNVIEVIINDLVDEQTMLREFPEAYWIYGDGKVRFYLESSEENKEKLERILKEKK